jgi:hypothetical protein
MSCTPGNKLPLLQKELLGKVYRLENAEEKANAMAEMVLSALWCGALPA